MQYSIINIVTIMQINLINHRSKAILDDIYIATMVHYHDIGYLKLLISN